MNLGSGTHTKTLTTGGFHFHINHFDSYTRMNQFVTEIWHPKNGNPYANHSPKNLSTMIKNIVLVHGAWADGSGWEEVHRI
jgi:hypothetical protein